MGDSQDRLALSLHAVGGLGDQGREGAALQKELLLTDCRKSFARLIAEKHSREASKLAAQAKDSSSHPDELIDFSHLKAREGLSQLEIEDSIATDLKRAMGDTTAEDAGDGVAKLDRMVQLTGFSDSVYAEAYVTTHQYDIVLDVTVANRTADTLQNLCLELATMGDLKLVERPRSAPTFRSATCGPSSSGRTRSPSTLPHPLPGVPRPHRREHEHEVPDPALRPGGRL